MQFLWMSLMALGIVAADQITKLLVVAQIPLHGQVPVIEGLVHWTYTQNTGAAFSSFEGMQWLFLLVFLAFTAMVIWEFSGKRMPFTNFERWLVAAIYAGGLGNMIDRIRLGYVVDMIRTEFISFPVFNVADCFITCGAIALMVSTVLFNKELREDKKK